jgi:quercetin dioxygenase-like cupin family protein
MALHHARPGEVVDLRPAAENPQAAHTVAIVKTEDFEAIRLVVPAGAEIPSHRVSGSLTLQCLEGRVELGLATAPVVLKAHDWVYLDGDAVHAVRAIEDSALLLTIFLTRKGGA